jgi:hypothetical protein
MQAIAGIRPAVHTGPINRTGKSMDAVMMFMDCPEWMDKHGDVRCGLPAEVESRYTFRSTDGPLEGAKIRCPRGHWFNGPVESLTLSTHPGAAIPRSADANRHDAASLPARRARPE